MSGVRCEWCWVGKHATCQLPGACACWCSAVIVVRGAKRDTSMAGTPSGLDLFPSPGPATLTRPAPTDAGWEPSPSIENAVRVLESA